jgi:hypothetical protein
MVFLLSSLSPVELPYIFKNFHQCWAANENAGRRRGLPAMKLALTDRNVAVSLAQLID